MKHFKINGTPITVIFPGDHPQGMGLWVSIFYPYFWIIPHYWLSINKRSQCFLKMVFKWWIKASQKRRNSGGLPVSGYYPSYSKTSWSKWCKTEKSSLLNPTQYSENTTVSNYFYFVSVVFNRKCLVRPGFDQMI